MGVLSAGWYAVAAVVVQTACTQGVTCPSIDGAVPKCDVPTGLGLCSGISYSACQQSSWAEQELAAQKSLDLLDEQYGYIVNRSSACRQAVVAYRCSVEFLACEGIDGEAQPVCSSSCQSIRDTCELQPDEIEAEDDEIERLYDLDERAYKVICDNKYDEDLAEDECFSLGYTGPSYYLWAIGLGLAVGFSFLNAVALNIQKISLNSHGPDVPVLKQPLWILGFAILLTGSLMDFVSLGLAPASLIAPLAALSLVWNMIAAPLMLKEKLSKTQIAATMIIFVGAVVTVSFSSHASPAYSLEILKELFLRGPMSIYTIVMPGLIMLHMITIEVIEHLSAERRASRALSTIHMIGYAGAAGITGGQSILFAKAVMEVFKSAFAGEPGVWFKGETYVIISAMVLCLLIQITYLNGGLMYHNSLTVVPVYQAYWIVSGVLGGLVYFDEIRTMSTFQVAMFATGIMITIGGVAFLAYLAHTHHRVAGSPTPLEEGGYVSDEEEEDYHPFYAETNAFNNFVNTTPRASAAEVLLDMGLAPNKVRNLVGSTNPRVRTFRQKELVLKNLGVRPDIAAKMLRSMSDRSTLRMEESEFFGSSMTSIDEERLNSISGNTGRANKETSEEASLTLS